MRRSFAAIGVFLLLARLGGPATAAVSSSTQADRISPEVSRLVQQLSADQWKERRNAQERLAAMGAEAEPDLQRLLAGGTLDPEARKSIQTLLARIAEERRVGPSRVTLKENSILPREFCTALAHQAKIQFSPSTIELLDNASLKPAAVAFDHTPLWDVILELQEKYGIRFQSVSSEGRIVLVRAESYPPAAPGAVAGPFLCTIGRLDAGPKRAISFAGYRTGPSRLSPRLPPGCQIQLHAWAEPHVNAMRWWIDSVDECMLDSGRHLDLPAGRAGTSAGGLVNSASFISLWLEGQLGQAKHIRRLSLTCRFALVRTREKIEVANILAVRNATFAPGGFGLVVKSVQKVVGNRYAYDVSISRNGKDPAEWDLLRSSLGAFPCRLVDSAGRVLIPVGGNASYRAEEIDIVGTALTAPVAGDAKSAEPVKLIWEFPTAIEQVTRPIVFRNIPLP